MMPYVPATYMRDTYAAIRIEGGTWIDVVGCQCNAQGSGGDGPVFGIWLIGGTRVKLVENNIVGTSAASIAVTAVGAYFSDSVIIARNQYGGYRRSPPGGPSLDFPAQLFVTGSNGQITLLDNQDCGSA